MITVESRSEYLENGKPVSGPWERFELAPETITCVSDGRGGNLPLKNLEAGFDVAWQGDFNRHQIYPRVRVVKNPDYVPCEYLKHKPPSMLNFDEFNVRRHGSE